MSSKFGDGEGMIMILKRFLLWRRNTTKFKKGGMYTVDTHDGFFKIVKILVIDLSVVHICLYKNKFSSRPKVVNISKLRLGATHDDDFSMGHISLSIKEFCSWQPKFLIKESVSEVELEGYEIWKKTQGGFFNF